MRLSRCANMQRIYPFLRDHVCVSRNRQLGKHASDASNGWSASVYASVGSICSLLSSKTRCIHTSDALISYVPLTVLTTESLQVCIFAQNGHSSKLFPEYFQQTDMPLPTQKERSLPQQLLRSELLFGWFASQLCTLVLEASWLVLFLSGEAISGAHLVNLFNCSGILSVDLSPGVTHSRK